MTKTVTRVVTHPKLYMSVDGKIQRLTVGREITLSAGAAERLKGKLADPAKTDRIEDGKTVPGGEDERLTEAQAEIAALKKSNGTEAVQQLGQQLAKAQAEIAALKKAAKK